MDENPFVDPRVAELYDVLNQWGPSDDFYLNLVMQSDSVLDVGCGTGLVLRTASEAGHPGRLAGLDPAAAMLEIARRQSPDIEWVHGDLSTVRFDREFDLVIMTGHTFQVFLEDDGIRETLVAIHHALAEDGQFAFESRNPAARAWEQWTPENAVEIDYPGGGVVRVEQWLEGPVTGELVRFWTRSTGSALDGPIEKVNTLRFLDAASIETLLAESGMKIDEQYGDWDRSPLTGATPEIITIARRA